MYLNNELKEAKIEDREYQERIRVIIRRVLQAAFVSKDLEMFFNEIVKLGAEKADAKSCAIFLLDEDEHTLRLKAASGEFEEVLKGKRATYYMPDRPCFKNKSDGKRKIEEYLKEKGLSLEKLREEKKTLMDVIDSSKENLVDLIEAGKLPMGITAYVVLTEEPVIVHGKRVREHPEWRGSYEGAHEICTSLIEVPLKVPNKGKVGMIKIENYIDSEAIYNFEELDRPEICERIYKFGDRHREILEILTDCVVLAIENVLYRTPKTYKKLFGTELLRKLDELRIQSNPSINEQIYEEVKKFYGQIRIKIEDVGGMEELYKRSALLIKKIAQILDLHPALGVIDSIGPAFEPLLGTDVRYREHFIHQFQVFLLGYYLINKKERLQKFLINHLREINTRYATAKDDEILEDILRIWFLASIFHDFAYSVGKMEGWLKKYFERVQIHPYPKILISWSDMLAEYEIEKTRLIQLVSRFTNKKEEEIAELIKNAFIKELDHGVIGSLMLMNILRNEIDEIILKEACCAIALHTDNVYSKLGNLTLTQFPFAFLLIFCDTAQQWGRPKIATLAQDINITLEDITTDDCSKVEIKLKFEKGLTEEQKIAIRKGTWLPIVYWHSENNLEFRISLWENDEIFGDYTFPS
jgi:hypothetical protein